MLRNTSRGVLRASRKATNNASRRYAHSAASFNWQDPLGAESLYTADELAIQDTARQYCQEKLLPRVLGMLSARFEPQAMTEIYFKCAGKLITIVI